MENQIILEFVVSERKQVEEINKGNFVLKDVRLKFTSEEWLEVPDEIRQIILSDSHFRREKMEFQLRYSLDAIGKDQAIECLQDIHQKRVDKANFDEEFKKFEIKMVKELEGLKNDFKLEDIRFYEFPDIVFVTIQKDTIRVDTNISAGEYLKFEGYLPRLSELISEKISEKEEAEKIALEEKITLDTAKLAMKNWALQNGSDLLKARIEEDMNWISLAESEYLKLNFPLLEKWQVIYTNNDEAKKSWEINNATLAQIEALRAERKKFGNAALERVRFEDEYGEVSHCDYVTTTVKLPSSTEVKLCYYLNDYPEDSED